MCDTPQGISVVLGRVRGPRFAGRWGGRPETSALAISVQWRRGACAPSCGAVEWRLLPMHLGATAEVCTEEQCIVEVIAVSVEVTKCPMATRRIKQVAGL